MIETRNCDILRLRDVPAGQRWQNRLLVGAAIALASPVICFGATAPAPAAAASEPLAQAIAERASADGFELLGADQIGNETVTLPSGQRSVPAIRKLLTGYNYILELGPGNAADETQRKPVRLRILGHSVESSGDVAAAAALSGAAPAGSAPNGESGIASNSAVAPTVAQPGSADPTAHPVIHMLQSIAATTLPQQQAAQSAAAQPAPVAAGDPVHNASDMAALTRTASTNLSALVSGLKAACPAGSKC